MATPAAAVHLPCAAARLLERPRVGLEIARAVLAGKNWDPCAAVGDAATDSGAIGATRLVALAADAAEQTAARANLTLAMLFCPEPSPILADLTARGSRRRAERAHPPLIDGPVPAEAARHYVAAVIDGTWTATMRRQQRRDPRTRYVHRALLAGDPRPLLRQALAETPYRIARARDT